MPGELTHVVTARGMRVLSVYPEVDTILESWRHALKSDYDGYRNHVYRVLNFCGLLHDLDDESLRKLAIAGAFHDLGIWSAGSFDYLGPSCALAHAYLEEQGLTQWQAEIETIIELHHKVGAAGGNDDLAELFRRADGIDVTLGMRRFELPRESIVAVQHCFPDHGFHMRLATLALKRLLTNPLNPLPMVRR